MLASLAREGLIRELVAVDGLAARAIAVREVATLAHKLLNDAVEGGAGVAEALLTRAKSTEVLRRLGDGIGKELHDDTAGRLATDLNVHPDLRVGGDDGVVGLVGHGEGRDEKEPVTSKGWGNGELRFERR